MMLIGILWMKCYGADDEFVTLPVLLTKGSAIHLKNFSDWLTVSCLSLIIIQ
jgi:hypothetical protein